MIASLDLARRLDPVIMARTAGIDPDDWQQQLLRSAHRRIICNCCRQSGKSTMAAIIGLHEILYIPASLVLCLSPTLRQSSELAGKVFSLYHRLNRPVEAKSETVLSLTLTNESRVVSLPGSEDTTRGYSAPTLIIVDEGSRVHPDLFYSSLRPMLAVSNGRLIVLSTPNGHDEVFWRCWQSEDEDWERYEVPAHRVPRISPAFLAQEEKVLTRAQYRQEYCCDFTLTEGSIFREEDVAKSFSEDYEAWVF